MNKTFESVGGARPPRSVFDLSYTHLTTGDMGLLYPVMVRECVPGDVMSVGLDLVIRFMPLTSPMLHKVDAYVHYFFVPYRLLWNDWESFITGGADGTEAPTMPTMSGSPGGNGLMDYLGFPVGVNAVGVLPVQFPVNAYNLIYNEYYRDQTSIAERTLTTSTIARRAWAKDYFTSALPWQQRGTAPSLPISGTIEVDGIDRNVSMTAGGQTDALKSTTTLGVSIDNYSAEGSYVRWDDPALEVDLSSATTFDVADLRLAFQIQKFLERNARAGARYTEFLQAHFNVAPRDDRLQRPEYFGGARMPIIVSEVLQTSETGTTPQGNLAGHGITAGRTKIGKYRCQEFGLIMGILSVMPDAIYEDGVDRQWIKATRYDFYFPEFAHLSEQPVYNGEVWVTTGDATANQGVFGYQERYAEMRSAKSIVTGGMRGSASPSFDGWHLSRQFSSLPTLGQTFLECTPRDDPAFAVPGEPQMVMHIGNRIVAARPMPRHSDPGLIDH